MALMDGRDVETLLLISHFSIAEITTPSACSVGTQTSRRAVANVVVVVAVVGSKRHKRVVGAQCR